MFNSPLGKMLHSNPCDSITNFIQRQAGWKSHLCIPIQITKEQRFICSANRGFSTHVQLKLQKRDRTRSSSFRLNRKWKSPLHCHERSWTLGQFQKGERGRGQKGKQQMSTKMAGSVGSCGAAVFYLQTRLEVLLRFFRYPMSISWMLML